MADRRTAIRASQLRNFSVTAEDLANESITGNKLVDGTISGSKIADDAINGSKLEDDSITNAKIVDNTIKVSKLNIVNSYSSGQFLGYEQLGDSFQWSTIPTVTQYDLSNGYFIFNAYTSGTQDSRKPSVLFTNYHDDDFSTTNGSLGSIIFSHSGPGGTNGCRIESKVETTDAYDVGLSFGVSEGNQHLEALYITASGVIQAKADNYEILVVSDDDIPNKKYVDDLVSTVVSDGVTNLDGGMSNSNYGGVGESIDGGDASSSF